MPYVNEHLQKKTKEMKNNSIKHTNLKNTYMIYDKHFTKSLVLSDEMLFPWSKI